MNQNEAIYQLFHPKIFIMSRKKVSWTPKIDQNGCFHWCCLEQFATKTNEFGNDFFGEMSSRQVNWSIRPLSHIQKFNPWLTLGARSPPKSKNMNNSQRSPEIQPLFTFSFFLQPDWILVGKRPVVSPGHRIDSLMSLSATGVNKNPIWLKGKMTDSQVIFGNWPLYRIFRDLLMTQMPGDFFLCTRCT